MKRRSARKRSAPAGPAPTGSDRGEPVGEDHAADTMRPEAVGSIAVSRDLHGIASTGDRATIVQIRARHATALPPEAFSAPAAPPAGLVRLPVRPAMFVGREPELSRLDAAVAARPVVVQAVHGLGGIGKSTLAARWAQQHIDDFALIWWITADSMAALDAGLVELAAALEPGLQQVLSSEVLRERVVQWLASHDRWLLILDNVTDPADIAGLLARLPQGRIVVTSRRTTGWPDLVDLVRLDVLTDVQAVDLLAAILARTGATADRDELGAVCAELGCLPLAVEQAGAYLTQTGVTPRDYLRLLAEYPAAMYADGEEGRDAQRTIARVWNVTLDRFAPDPLPGQMLRVLAWYASEAVPRTLLSALADPATTARAVGRLAAYSMITLNPATDTISVHRLVQAVTRTSVADLRTAGDLIDSWRTAVQGLTDAVPAGWQDPGSWPAWRTLLPHIDVLAAAPAPGESDLDARGLALLLHRTGLFLRSQGNVNHSASYLELAYRTYRRALGDDHPDTLTSANDLASGLRLAGALRQAIPLHRRALADLRRVAGDDHPRTLFAVNNLATSLRLAGQHRQAIPLHQQALADRRRVLGDDHPDTLSSVHNLAAAYCSAGDLDRAIPLFEQALADRRRVLGDTFPDTLTSANDLATAYRSAGDLARAVPLLEAALADRRRVLGDDHPDTLTSVHGLAAALQSTGDLGRAIALYEEALAGRRRVLGDDHPDTLESAGRLERSVQDRAGAQRPECGYE
ncbi:tetratricopeptide repeat protein [Dactylosporangium sp. CA-139066]|uniref:tetratricopeptide repeat protein n=1 Tax=Dactylosporangium sp. CA-139066 TaxID=3239930 RepID=UPI003D917A47